MWKPLGFHISLDIIKWNLKNKIFFCPAVYSSIACIEQVSDRKKPVQCKQWNCKQLGKRKSCSNFHIGEGLSFLLRSFASTMIFWNLRYMYNHGKTNRQTFQATVIEIEMKLFQKLSITITWHVLVCSQTSRILSLMKKVILWKKLSKEKESLRKVLIALMKYLQKQEMGERENTFNICHQKLVSWNEPRIGRTQPMKLQNCWLIYKFYSRKWMVFSSFYKALILHVHVVAAFSQNDFIIVVWNMKTWIKAKVVKHE